MTVHVGSTFSLQRLHKRWSFPLIKSAGNCGFCHICERNRYWRTSLFVQWKCLQITKVTLLFFKLWTCYIFFINLFQFIYKKFLFTTVILSSFLLLSESISEWVKDSYQNLFISKFPVGLNIANGSTVSLCNSLKNWTIAGTIKSLFPPLFQERSPLWKIVNICEINVIEKSLEDECSSQSLRNLLQAALFNSSIHQSFKFFSTGKLASTQLLFSLD